MLTLKQVAEYLKVSEQTIWNWKKAGKIPYLQIGGKHGVIRFNKEEIDNWLSCKVQDINKEYEEILKRRGVGNEILP